MPEPGSIRISIGASLDRSVAESFGSIEKMAERTGRNVQKNLGGSSNGTAGAGMGRAFRTAATEADKASRDMERSWNRQVKAAEKASSDEFKAFQKAGKERLRLQAQIERDADRSLTRQTRAAERESANQVKIAENAAKKIDSDRQRFASRTSQRAVRFLFPNPIGAFGMASRIGGDLMRGAGVDFSVAGSVSRAVGVQSLAAQLSNQGYRAGDSGAAGKRVEGSVLESEARSVGKGLSLDPAKLLEAQTKFVDVTGDLDGSRKNMKGLAEIAVATHTDFVAMAEAAGNISRHLAETPDKAEKLAGIMRVLAGQGKVGSIEIKDFAAQMAKVAAIAPKFAGDVGENITKLTTIAQLSRAEGGSATAAQAATATARFADTFTSGARLKKFAALGIDPYTDKGHTQLKDPFEIIRESVNRTKGSATGLGDLFKSVMSQRAITALSSAYNQAGGGKAGMSAVNSQLAIFGKESAITKDEVAQDVAKNQDTIAAKAQKFQDQLDEIVSKLAQDVIPAFEKLEPNVLKIADAFGKLIDFAATNPVDAILAAIALAIGRAALESTFRSAIEKALTGGGGGGIAGIGTGTATGKLGKAFGAVGSGLTGAAIGYGAGEGINALTGSKDASLSRDMALVGGFAMAGAQMGGPLGALIGTAIGGAASIADQGKGLYDVTAGFSDWGGGKMSKPGTPEDWDRQHAQGGFRADHYSPSQRDPKLNEPLKIDHMSLAQGVTQGLRGTTLNVNVLNMPANGPTVSPLGRTAAPSPFHR